MKHFALVPSALALTLAASAILPAQVTLLAKGTLTSSRAGSYRDLSGLSAPLENGVPNDLLGGFGSGIAHLSGDTFLAVPDRGPNAVSYNSLIDDTASYINRVHTIKMNLAPNTGSGLPFTITPKLELTQLLHSGTPLVYGSGSGLGVGSGEPKQNRSGKYYFTGRSDNYNPDRSSRDPNDARLDPESIRVAPDGKTIFISDEYGPYVYQFDRATGSRIRAFALPANLNVANLSPMGATEISGNTSGRVANKGMEGLAITPDGKTLVGIMQAPLIQDPAGLLRIVTIDIATGATHEYGYQLTAGTGVSEITAINDHQFLVDERDGKGLGDGSKAKTKDLFTIDLAGATDITNLSGADALAAVVNKSTSLVTNLVTLLGASLSCVSGKFLCP